VLALISSITSGNTTFLRLVLPWKITSNVVAFHAVKVKFSTLLVVNDEMTSIAQVNVFIELQPLNASDITSVVAGISSSSIFVQPSNALEPTFLTDAGMITFVKLEHPEKD
jgi:hypothetical protein